MTSHYRHQRTANPATAFPSPIEPGEIAVNTANRQIVVGDANATGIGNPLALLAVRVFDARAIYSVGDYVVQAGTLYRCTTANGPGSFVAANWVVITDKTYVDAGDAAAIAHADAGDAAIIANYQSADASITTAFQNADAAIITNYQSADASINTALALKAPIASPLFTGDPRAPTPAPGDSDTSIATTAFVNAALTGAAVRYDVTQALAAAQQQQARQNIFAAPFDAMAYSGMQINGSMEVSQEKGTSGTTTAASYICDGWRLGFSGTMVISAVGEPLQFIPGYGGLLYATAPTPQASLGAGDYAQIAQRIEGYRCQRLAWGGANAQPITIGFWSTHTLTGLYSVAIRNGAANRSYVATYTQAASDARQYNAVTIPGDTTGAWNFDNTVGMEIVFSLGCGSTNTAPSTNAWIAGSYYAAPGQVNCAASASNVCRIVGVTVHPGNEAPSAARSPFIMRPYDQELNLCMRYYEMLVHGSGGAGGDRILGAQTTPPSASVSVWSFKVRKRVLPTFVWAAGSSFTSNDSASVDYVTLLNNNGICIMSGGSSADARL